MLEAMTAPAALRADAARNRRRLLEAAARVFAEHGMDASVDDIAREAGVGIGTLYRRFATKDELIAAVLDDRFETIAAAIEAAGGLEDPMAALETAMAELAAGAVLHRALLHNLAYSGCHAPLVQAAKERVTAEFDAILARARAAGVVRDDIVARDLMTLGGMLSRLPAWQLEQEPDVWRRYLALMLDGLRPETAHALPHPPSRAVPPFTR
jgi:AcrR family transcriptional regulator